MLIRYTLIFLVVLALAGCFKKEGKAPAQESENRSSPPPALRTVELRMTQVPQVYQSTGEAQPIKVVYLSSEVSGRIVARPVQVGSRVQPGDPLFEIDDELWRVQREQILANIDLQKARLEQARRDVERERRLQSMTTEEKTEQVQLREIIEQKTLVTLEKKLDELDVYLRKTRLVAPWAGEVAALFLEAEEYAMVGPMSKPLVKLIDRTQMKLLVEVPGTLVQHLHAVASVPVKIWDLDKTVQARLIRVYATANELTKKFPVELQFTNADGAVLSGMFCQVSFSLGVSEQLLISSTWVRKAYGVYFVLASVQANGPFVQRVIRGEEREANYQILEGVKAGEWLREY